MSRDLCPIRTSTHITQVSVPPLDSSPTYIKINSTGGGFWVIYDRKQLEYFNQETLFSQATRSAAVSCVRCCAVSSNWHVYLCLDGITKYTLDGTYRRTVGQLRFFLHSLEYSPHSVLKVFMSGVMVILQVTFLYLADWYVRLDLARIASLQLTSTSYNTYASSAQAGQSLFRTSSTLGRLYPPPRLDSSVFPQGT